MGIQQIVIDDLTGEQIDSDVKPTEVTVDGTDYSLYLGDASKKRFVAFLKGEEPLVSTTTGATSKGRRTGSGRKPIDTYGYDFNEVRAWAIANKVKSKAGKPISEQTRVLNQEIYDEYKAAQS